MNRMKYFLIACTLIFFMGCEDVNVYAPGDNNDSNNSNGTPSDCSSINCTNYCANIDWQDLNNTDTTCLSSCNCKIPDSILDCDKDQFRYCRVLIDENNETSYLCSDEMNSKVTCNFSSCDCQLSNSSDSIKADCSSCN